MVDTGENITMDCFGEALNLAAPPEGAGPPGCALVTFFSDFFLKFVIVKCIILKFVIVIVM